MAKTLKQMVAETREGIPLVSPEEAKRQMEGDPNTLMVEVRDAADIRPTGIIPGAAHVSAGMLPVRADHEMPEQYRDPRLQDRERPVIVTCGAGLIASMGAKTLKEMGFTNVSILEGGTKGWKEAGYQTEPFGDA